MIYYLLMDVLRLLETTIFWFSFVYLFRASLCNFTLSFQHHRRMATSCFFSVLVQFLKHITPDNSYSTLTRWYKVSKYMSTLEQTRRQKKPVYILLFVLLLYRTGKSYQMVQLLFPPTDFFLLYIEKVFTQLVFLLVFLTCPLLE